jgi:hypothetical protein
MQNDEKDQPTDGGSFITHFEGADGQGQYLARWMMAGFSRKIAGVRIVKCDKGTIYVDFPYVFFCKKKERERYIYIYIQIMNLTANYPD